MQIPKTTQCIAIALVCPHNQIKDTISEEDILTKGHREMNLEKKKKVYEYEVSFSISSD